MQPPFAGMAPAVRPSIPMIAETFRQDLRIGVRVLVKDKGFAALSVFVLALGICAVATMKGWSRDTSPFHLFSGGRPCRLDLI